MSAPFIVFSLPRSRSTWLARFLSYGPWRCGHDELRHIRTLDDVKTWFSQPFTGTAETAGAPWWRLLPHYAPSARVVVVRRPVGDVIDSLMRIKGVSFDRDRLTENMGWLDRKLGQLAARVSGVISVDYADLDSEQACASIFEHCTDLAHDHAWWSMLAPINLQSDMVETVRYAAAYAHALERAGYAAKQQVLASMASSRRPVPPDGMTFQLEPYDMWIRDAEALFEQHCIVIGEEPCAWRRKNLPLMKQLYDRGVMQIMTARSNGRMFGYLMTILSPSLAYRDMLSGTNTTFFASPEFPGLGLKLQRAVIRSLKERGAGEMFFEAGKRGDGPRLGAMYRRLGAVEHGQVFRMNLMEA